MLTLENCNTTNLTFTNSPTSSKYLKCFYFNSRSLCNKLNNLAVILDSGIYDIIFICETWLNNNFFDAEILRNSNYCIFRHDRIEKAGRGVAVIFKKYLDLQNIELPNIYMNSEIIALNLNTTSYKYRIILCYKPPGVSSEYNDLFLQCLRWASSITESSRFLMIIGDFNLPNIKWNNLDYFNENSLSYEFIKYVNDFGLIQLVKIPTLGDNILDLILCEHIALIFDVNTCPPFSCSDHNSLEFNLLGENIKTVNDQVKQFDFINADYDIIGYHLSIINWFEFFSSCVSIDDYYNKFLNLVNQLILDFVPCKYTNSKLYYPKHILKLQSKKRLLWKKLKQNKNYKYEYKMLCLDIEQKISDFYASKEMNLLNKGSNLKHFYKFVNNRIKTKQPIPVLDVGNTVLSDDLSKANAFNEFFASVFVKDNNILIDINNRLDHYPDLTIAFTPEIVLKALSKMKPSFSKGPDDLSAFFLKKLKYWICEPLSMIFEASYRLGNVPRIWLEAIVVPIFKKGLSSKIENYRPISLCCVSCKLMETIINDAISLHLINNNILRDEQYGFQKNKSCTSQLLNCINKWTKSIDSNKPVDVIYIDFQKAFDSVVHSKLLNVLSTYGIKNSVLKWLNSFLSNRIQRVKVNNSISHQVHVRSGVPQGSVLGPTLFLIFINDLINQVNHSEVLLFADDIKIFNISEHNAFLQNDLNSIFSWSKKWQLPISLEKSNVLYLGNKNPKHAYKLGAHNLQDVGYSCKDLGVYISSDLSWNIQCANTVSKASKVANLIHRCFISKNIDLKVRAFKTYVRPILEYATPVWNPHSKFNIESIEKIQRKFTKRLFKGISTSLSYEDRLKQLSLETLESRRRYFDAVYAYKIIRCNLLNFDDFYCIPPQSATRSRYHDNLYIPKFRLDCRKNSFSIRSSRIWNHLPDDIKQCRNIIIFKRALKSIHQNLGF